MPRGYQVLESVPGGIFVAMLAGNADPCFAGCAASIGPVFVRMDVEPGHLTQAVLQFVGMDIDHQCPSGQTSDREALAPTPHESVPRPTDIF
jgi:hypothetical protein